MNDVAPYEFDPDFSYSLESNPGDNLKLMFNGDEDHKKVYILNLRPSLGYAYENGPSDELTQ